MVSSFYLEGQPILPSYGPNFYGFGGQPISYLHWQELNDLRQPPFFRMKHPYWQEDGNLEYMPNIFSHSPILKQFVPELEMPSPYVSGFPIPFAKRLFYPTAQTQRSYFLPDMNLNIHENLIPTPSQNFITNIFLNYLHPDAYQTSTIIRKTYIPKALVPSHVYEEHGLGSQGLFTPENRSGRKNVDDIDEPIQDYTNERTTPLIVDKNSQIISHNIIEKKPLPSSTTENVLSYWDNPDNRVEPGKYSHAKYGKYN